MTAAASLGAINSMAGATPLVPSEGTPSGVTVTVGVAVSIAYTANSPLSEDGRWSFAPEGSAPYRTRVLVRRPSDRARFSGTVVVEWLNVSGGIDLDPVWGQASAEIIRGGNAWVGVSAQRAGVNGPPFVPGFSQPLTVWDPARYGTLAIPDDHASYGIFTAATRVAREGALTAWSPGDVLIASGSSQSANRLVTYVNGVDALEHAVDGFLAPEPGCELQRFAPMLAEA